MYEVQWPSSSIELLMTIASEDSMGGLCQQGI